VVPANGSVDLPITFRPLVMTQPSGRDRLPPLKGSVFLALPTGKAKLFDLTGTSSDPDPQPLVTAKCPAKKMTLV
jgi:hypothetical protein